MIPLRNGSEYYKKMLELQERLRRSEEERIRLEERFSMLEHESRSRHETCINRLRMRYIEFLEEQQARDERNHRLLGALDRVDSSLALMSAKTDRLGALRKQYETLVLSSYNNRTNGSMTGDSGVASQNDEKQRRNNNAASGNKNKYFLSDRGTVSLGRDKSITGSTHSFSQVRSDPRYGNWSGMNYESSQMIHSPIGSARFPQSGAAGLINKGSGPLSSSMNSVNSRKLLSTKSRIDRDTIPQSSPACEYRFNSSRYAMPEYSLRKSEPANYSSDWHDAPTRTVMRDLDNCGAYDSRTVPSRSFNNSSGHSRDSFQSEQRVASPNLARPDPGKRLHDSSNYSGSLKDQLIMASNQTPYTKVTDILRQELGDEEEYIGSVVENELERYISKIRNLHRETDPQSVEELDHEQNTSGDLLNVTLSDDGVDFSVEDKPRLRALPQHLGNVLALAKDLANRTATSANNVANVYHQEVDGGVEQTGTGADEGLLVVNPHTSRDDKDSPSASNAVYQLTSVNPKLSTTRGYGDEGHDVSNEKFPLLAKIGISAKVAKASSELAARPHRNIEDVSKSVRNSQDTHVTTTDSSRIDTNEKDDYKLRVLEEEQNQDLRDDRDKLLIEDAASLKELDDAYKVITGEEREVEHNLRDIAEELEPWNLNALERRVQEIILNDEAQADYIRRESDGLDASRPQRDEQAISDIHEKSYMDNQNMDYRITGNETANQNEFCQNETSSFEEPVESLSGIKSEDESSQKVKQHDSSLAIADQSVNRLTQEHAKESREQGDVPETPDCLVDAGNLVNPSIDYEAVEGEKNYSNDENESYARGEYPQDSNAPYADYTENGQYQGDPNEQYQNYESNNVQYEQDPNGQYPYVDEQYQPVYTEDPNAQQQYDQDPNAQQQYEQDPNTRQQYEQDPNTQQQYEQDPNTQQQYEQDSNAQQQYEPDSNTQQQYEQDPNTQQQYEQDSNAQQQYEPDSNTQQQYEQDPNAQQQYEQDPNAQQQYEQDPNQSYLEDAGQQYIADTDQEYAVDPNQQYATDANYEQYVGDPTEDYSTNVDQQQYQQNEAYLQDDSRAYPASSADYVYPQGQEYADNEAYEPNAQLEPDGGQGYVEGQEASVVYESQSNFDEDPSKGSVDDQRGNEPNESADTLDQKKNHQKDENSAKKSKDVIKSLLDSDTESTIEKNVSNTESDFDFN